jgi:hypothetical protein
VRHLAGRAPPGGLHPPEHRPVRSAPPESTRRPQVRHHVALARRASTRLRRRRLAGPAPPGGTRSRKPSLAEPALEGSTHRTGRHLARTCAMDTGILSLTWSRSSSRPRAQTNWWPVLVIMSV